jgi:CRP-like cAMP-binding protein
MLRLRKGDKLYRKGDDATKNFMVQRGRVALIDKSHTVEILGPNRWLIEAHELAHVFLHTAEALTDCGVMAFEADQFVDLLTRHPILNAKFLQDMAERWAERNDNGDPAAKRLARHFVKLCGDNDVLVLENAAPTSLGIQIAATRQTVTDILKQFHKTGMVIKLGVRRYRLHKPALQQFLGMHIGDGDGI